jgi:hypothetical protein
LRTLQQLTLILVLIGHVISAFPGASIADSDPVDDCCASATTTPAGDCCPDDCSDCPLACCAGNVAVTGSLFVGSIEPAGAPGFPPTRPMCPSGTDPREIDHPPRV